MIKGFKELSVEDYAVFWQYREDMTISDMGFTQLFAWQGKFRNHYKILNGYLCILYQRDNGEYSCYAPLGKYEEKRYNETILKLKEDFDGAGIPFRFDFVPEDWLARFGHLAGYEISAACNDDFSDYLYRAEDFLELKGKANEQKRYLVRYFEKHFSYEYQSLTTENMAWARSVVEAWCAGRDCKDCYWGCEKEAIFKVLDNWKLFNCRGALVLVDGEAKALMIGEKIRYDMVVSHFQKADRTVKGLYAFISNRFYIQEYPGIAYINLQEDMGIEGLRKSKMSYKPWRMIRKYTITLTERKGQTNYGQS